MTEQWQKLYSLPVLVARYLRGECTSDAERIKAEEVINTWHERLGDISWFMRSLNEYLARRGNEEDSCTGRFWEGRFRSQALLDDAAVLTCMSYVDLNPLRAGMAATPEESDFTSIQQRLRELSAEVASGKTDTIPAPNIPLMPLTPKSQDPHPNAIGFSLRDYLELVDWAGRAVREGKRGAINGNAPPILGRLNLDPYRFVEHLQGNASTERPTMLGKAEKLKQAARDLGRHFIKGISEAQRLYRSPLPS